jgi:uncharacterized protein DUF6941
MEIDLALLADAATVDGSGKLNILGVFDRITAGQFPVQHGRIALVLRFQAGVGDVGKHKLGIRLVGPSGKEIVGLNGEIQFGAGKQAAEGGVRVPQILNLDGIVFESAGLYNFDVNVDGEHHVSVPMTVVGPPATGFAEA